MIFSGNDLIRSRVQYTKLYLGNFILLNKLKKKHNFEYTYTLLLFLYSKFLQRAVDVSY